MDQLRIILELDAVRDIHAAAGDAASQQQPEAAAASGNPKTGNSAPDCSCAVRAAGSTGSAPSGAAEAGGAAGGASAAARPPGPDGSGSEGLPTVRCGPEDVAALMSHWGRMPAAWRASVSAGCE